MALGDDVTISQNPIDPITEEDIVSAYRLMLGRKPENRDVVLKHLQQAPDLASFRQRFFALAEFYKVNFRAIQANTVGRAYNAKMGTVEADVTPEDLQRFFVHIQDVWSKLGEVEPFFSVWSSPQFKPDVFSDSKQKFYSSGEREVDELLARLKGFGLSLDPAGRAVEFGCGVGRVTRYLAPHFSHVCGIDISKPHLDLAAQWIASEEVGNVDLVWLEDMDRLSVPAHDFFFSRIVLQHNPPPVAKYLLRRVLFNLRPGGVAVFQAVTSIENYSFSAKKYLEQMENFNNQELHVLPQRDVFEVMSDCGIRPVDVTRDLSVPGLHGVSTVFTARKPR